MRWFYPNLSKEQCDNLLLSQGVVGSYLVRKATSLDADYVLMVKRDTTSCTADAPPLLCLRISGQRESYQLVGVGEEFASLRELINHYENHPIETEDLGGSIMLRYPLNREVPTTDRYFHAGLAKSKALLLVERRGHAGSFLVRESESESDTYVLVVKLENGQVNMLKIRRRNGRYDIGGGTEFASLDALIEHHKEWPLVDVSGNAFKLKQPVVTTTVRVRDIAQRLPETSQKDIMLMDRDTPDNVAFEFAILQREEDREVYPRRSGLLECNRSKNRYKNILPFDHSRVVLRPPSELLNPPSQFSCNDNPECDIEEAYAINGASGQRPPLAASTSASVPPVVDDKNDYINANYITNDPKSGDKRIFIACQGCTQPTLADYWRMIYQENVQVIVMLCREQEGRPPRNKCFRYWPGSPDSADVAYSNESETLTVPLFNKESKRNSAHFIITLKKVDRSEDFIVRTLSVKLVKNEKQDNEYDDDSAATNLELAEEGDYSLKLIERTIYHYQFTSWPDHKVPEDPKSLIRFISDFNHVQINIEQQYGWNPDSLGPGIDPLDRPPWPPLMVHCSAGIGRTGTVIVLDMLIRQIQMAISRNEIDTYEVDVLNKCKHLRQARSGMVQTEAQYRFIYQVLATFVEDALSSRASAS